MFFISKVSALPDSFHAWTPFRFGTIEGRSLIFHISSIIHYWQLGRIEHFASILRTKDWFNLLRSDHFIEEVGLTCCKARALATPWRFLLLRCKFDWCVHVIRSLIAWPFVLDDSLRLLMLWF